MGSVQQRVLRARAECEDIKPCVFTNIEHALHPDAAAMIDCLDPDANASAHDSEIAYTEMDDYLIQNASWACPSDQTASCLIHKKACPLHPGHVLHDLWRSGSSVSDYPSDFESVPWWESNMSSVFPNQGSTDEEYSERPSLVIMCFWFGVEIVSG